MKKYLSDDRLFILIRDFLTEYLPKQRFCSINTIDSYRATLNGYLEKMVVFDLSSRFKSKSTLFLLVVFCSITGILY